MQLEDLNEACPRGASKGKLKISSKIPHLELFGKSMLELRRYKVKDIFSHQVVLAVQYNYHSSLNIQQRRRLEQYTTEPNGEDVVIKTLQKSAFVFKPEDDKHSKTSILPINVPFMARLLRYYENDDFLHLVLEYVPGGELYKIVDHYFKKPLHPLGGEDYKCEETNESNFTNYLGNVITEKKTSSLNIKDSQNQLVSQSSQISCPSPYGAKSISVIKPSASFINIRKKSMPAPGSATLIQVNESNLQPNLNIPYDEKEDSVSASGSISSIDYVCTYTEAYEDDSKQSGGNVDLICINKDGIERIDCAKDQETTDNDESFDFINDFADEEGQDVAEAITLKKTRLSSSVEENLFSSSFELDEEEDTISATINEERGEYKPPDITMTFGEKMYSEPVKLVQDSKSLLATVSSKLTERQSQHETAEKILSRLENVESKIQSHLDERHISPMTSTLATPFEHTPAKVHPSLLFIPHDVTTSPDDKGKYRNSSISPLSPSTLATTPTSMMSSPPKYSSSSSEAVSPGSNNSIKTKNNTLKLWDLVPYYDHLNLRLTNCIPIGLLRKWSAQLCKALFNLHSRGIIIQDLRPSNLLLGKKICYFYFSINVS